MRSISLPTFESCSAINSIFFSGFSAMKALASMPSFASTLFSGESAPFATAFENFTNRLDMSSASTPAVLKTSISRDMDSTVPPNMSFIDPALLASLTKSANSFPIGAMIEPPAATITAPTLAIFFPHAWSLSRARSSPRCRALSFSQISTKAPPARTSDAEPPPPPPPPRAIGNPHRGNVLRFDKTKKGIAGLRPHDALEFGNASVTSRDVA